MADKKIELSVIIPAYNMEKYLGRCLDSILKQNIEKMEVIVVDAGSTDGTRKVLKEYASKDSKIKPIYSDVNLWCPTARNAGLSVAVGEYLAFCDADDTVPEGAYKELLHAAYYNNSDIVTGNYTCRIRNEIRNPVIYTKPTGIERCFESCNVSVWNKIYRSEFVGDLRFAEDIRVAEDAIFCMTLYRMRPSVSYTDACVYVYTIEKEEEEENQRHKELYYPYACFGDCMAVVRRVFDEPFEQWQELWSQLYVDYSGFLFNNFWFNLADAEEKKIGFEALRDTIKNLQKKNPVCDFSKNGLAMTFYNKFHTDFVTFQSLSYEHYILVLLMQQKNTPAALNVPDSFVNMCRHGEVGMRTILRSMKAWLSYKLKK